MPKGYRKDGTKLGFQKGKKFSKEHRKKLKKTMQGNRNAFKIGQKIHLGYILIHQPSHPRARTNGYIKRANLVMEKKLGRYLIPPELVHHKGIKYPLHSIENKQDDRPENLQLFANKSSHSSFHAKISHRSKKGTYC